MNLVPRFSAQPVLKLMLLLIAVAHVVKLALPVSFLRPLKKHGKPAVAIVAPSKQAHQESCAVDGIATTRLGPHL